MAISKLQAFTAIVLLLVPIAAKGDDVSPSLAPFYDELCKEVECGKGSCVAAPGAPFNFKCNCEDGWKRTRLEDQDEHDVEFLPCIIPNCTVDYSCMPAPPPAPSIPRNLSFFDPCHWIYCGEGTCAKNKTYAHTCQCNPGYSNLLNIPVFPCYSDCATGSDSCRRLGIRVANSTSNGSNSSSNDSNKAIALFSLGKFNWMAVVLATAAVAFFK